MPSYHSYSSSGSFPATAAAAEHQRYPTLDDVLTQQMSTVPVSFSAVFPVGQSPQMAFVGWTTPSFCYVESQFGPLEDDGVFPSEPDSRRYGQLMEVGRDSAKPTSFQTAFMVSLADLLPSHTQQLTCSVK